jgi:hypothetical protein
MDQKQMKLPNKGLQPWHRRKMAGKSKRDSLFKYHSFLFDTVHKVCIAGTARLLAGKMRWLTTPS